MKFAVRIWLWMTAFLFLLFVAEMGLRLIVPTLDPERQFRMIDGTGSVPTLAPQNSKLWQTSIWGEYNQRISIGPFGLRESKSLFAATGGSIFVVGDQFSFGQGVKEDQRFSNILESSLGVPVYNISMRGMLPWGHFKLVNFVEQIVRFAQDPEFKIRHLLVVISLPGAVRKYTDIDRLQLSPPLSDTENASGGNILNTVTKWLLEKTAIGLGVRILIYKRMLTQEYGLLSKLHLYDTIQNLRARVAPRARHVEPPVDLGEIQQTIEQLRNMAALRDIIFVIMPPKGEFLENGESSASVLHDEFIAQLAGSGLCYVDVQPALTKKAKSRSVLFRHAEQWNAAAHAVTATVVAKAVIGKWGVMQR